ncbi:MAG TPA: MarR family transcriptional regulator [Candidatus Limnocylindrales bacterium]
MSTAFPAANSGAADSPSGLAAGSPGAGEAAVDSLTDSLAAATASFAGLFDRWANRKATEAGISAQRLRLLNVVHCQGPQKMADLAEALAVTPRNVTALVDGLEAEGLIRRIPHSTDRRVTLVELTGGSVNVESQFRAFQDSIGSLFANLGEDDRRTLLRLLTTLHTRMHADGDKPADAGAMAEATATAND